MKSQSQVVYRLPITKARVNLGHVVKRVHLNKEYFILEKDGIPVAGIMGADELEDYLELRDPKVREHIRKSREEFQAGKSRPMDEFLAKRAARKNKGAQHPKP
jgi:PHD/YefM family antitoxin component YafN of YafNO toxin-antitoxin module